ncbi:Actin-fragmin kinase [Hondaea fermentalgiana]|uniref:Actin-fragmin kinase n=1 Tax=Hondaea fermentalgiana TaxID=2315210 RepID=A0A2R5H0N5_9STRA|nr:Actin-fragmin kinase [Hondaea fermentalgiana]|eukprot:GBG34331.1 Actin-fragmin kinase [Hondaea fermentalgiana]
MTEPSDAELAEAVAAAVAGREDLESDAAALTRAIADDHFLWKVRTQRVQAVLDARAAAKVPPRKVPDELFVLDWANATPGDVLAPLRADAFRVEGVHHAQGGLGSLGCFLVKLADLNGGAGGAGGGVVVLKQKPVLGVTHEFVAHGLLRQLGVSVPSMRVLGQTELDQLIFELRDAPVTAHGTCDEIHAPRFREAGAVLMSFEPGRNLEEEPLKGRRAGALDALDWRCLGAVLVADAIFNNSDRVPSIWRSEGNAGNLIVDERRPAGQRIVAIDQTVSVIMNEANRLKYFVRVGDLLSVASLKRVDEFFDLEGALGSEAAAAAILSIREGASEAIMRLNDNAEALVSSAIEEAVAEAKEDTFDARAVKDFLLQAISALPEVDLRDAHPEQDEEEGLLQYILSFCSSTADDEADSEAAGVGSTAIESRPAWWS